MDFDALFCFKMLPGIFLWIIQDWIKSGLKMIFSVSIFFILREIFFYSKIRTFHKQLNVEMSKESLNELMRHTNSTNYSEVMHAYAFNLLEKSCLYTVIKALYACANLFFDFEELYLGNKWSK